MHIITFIVRTGNIIERTDQKEKRVRSTVKKVKLKKIKIIFFDETNFLKYEGSFVTALLLDF